MSNSSSIYDVIHTSRFLNNYFDMQNRIGFIYFWKYTNHQSFLKV